MAATQIELHDLRLITNNFSDARKFRSGAYGDVYKTVYNKEEIAVKLLDPTKGIDDQQFMNELCNHMKVQHPNIVRLVGYCNEVTGQYVEQKDGLPVFGQCIYKVLCFEYMHGGSLDKRLSENSLGDDWQTHYQIIKGTCEGLCYLHNGCERPILHKDLKPANILLDKRMKPKIADFGLSKIYTASSSHVIDDSVSGTLKYMVPELRWGSESEKTDVFTLGVTIIYVIRGSDGFQLYHNLGNTKFVQDVCRYWSKRDRAAHLYQVETCTKIAIRCVDPQRKNRPTIKEIVADLNDMGKIELYHLRIITNHFSDFHKVGSGGYGEVYKAVYNGEEIAVRLLDAIKGIDDRQFMNVLTNHMQAQHPNIVRLVGYCNEVTNQYVEQKDHTPVFGKHIYKVLCFEYMHGRSLDKRLSENSLGDDWNTHYQIIKGACEGLCYLHNGCEHRILHLDLKPANILLDKSMKPKIADFGLSSIYAASRTHVKVDSVSGTTKYMAPELRFGREMSDKTDVFALGVTIIDIIKGSAGFEFYHELGATKFVEDVCTYWGKRDRTANLSQVETCTNIATCCVDPDRRRRPRIKDIIEHLNNTEYQSICRPRKGEGSTGPDIAGFWESAACPPGLHVPYELSSESSSMYGSSNRTRMGPVGVVIVYAFDCTETTPAWHTINDGVFWLVQEKLTHFVDSCLGYIYVMLTPNTYMSDMKVVDSAETNKTGYTSGAWCRMSCTKNMASGLAVANKMVTNHGYQNGIILFFSDGLINKSDFFDGTEDFISSVPVHTFTLGGEAYNHVLQSIAVNSPGGKFHPTPVPERPKLSEPFSKLLDSLFDGMDLDPVLDAKLPGVQNLKLHLEPDNLMPVVFELQRLKAITNNFSTTSEVGRGGYGVVYKGVLSSGKIIAVKKLESHLVKEEAFQSEVSSLAGMKHQNVVQIVGYCAETSSERMSQPDGKPIWVDFPNRLICLEYVCNGSLDKYISDETKGLEWIIRYNIIKGICSGLHFLHEECGIVHLDLKPENILMDAEMVPKIADFGLSRIFGNQGTQIVTNNCAGTRGYMAPEYFIHGKITRKADIYSLGVIIIEILTGDKDYPLSPYLQFFDVNDCPQSSGITFEHFMKEVLGRWWTTFKPPTDKSTTQQVEQCITIALECAEKYIEQVKQCITIALECVDPDRAKRPTSREIIQRLTAADQEDLSTHLPDSSAGHQNDQEATKTSSEEQSVTDQTSLAKKKKKPDQTS